MCVESHKTELIEQATVLEVTKKLHSIFNGYFSNNSSLSLSDIRHYPMLLVWMLKYDVT